MGRDSAIEWTDHTFNPWIGCTPVHAGCANCYAREWAHRFRPGQPFWTLRQTKQGPAEIARWNRKAREAGRMEIVFVCSLSDFFHEQADSWRAPIWEAMREAESLWFMLLTKRPERVAAALPAFVLENVAFGVSVSSSIHAGEMAPGMIDALVALPVAHRFVSHEPALEVIDARLWRGKGIEWWICGGESGQKARENINFRAQGNLCSAAGIPFFLKQLGSAYAWAAGLRDPKGADPDEWPDSLRFGAYRQRPSWPCFEGIKGIHVEQVFVDDPAELPT